MQVVPFKREEWRDAVAALKNIIGQLESGELEPCAVGALVMMGQSGAIELFGFGPKAEELQTLAVLRLGEQLAIQCLMDDGE